MAKALLAQEEVDGATVLELVGKRERKGELTTPTGGPANGEVNGKVEEGEMVPAV